MEYREKGRYALSSIRDGIRADSVAAKIAKYIAFSIFGILIVAVGALFAINDKTIEASAGPLASPALALKHGMLGVFGSASGALDNEGNSKTPRVVQELPPAPAPAALATPVQTRSLSEIAAENQQAYDQRDATMTNSAALESDPTQPPMNALSNADGAAPIVDQLATPSTGPPPPPPSMAATDENTDAPMPLGTAPPPPVRLAPESSAPVTPTTEPDTSEMALLESLDQESGNSVMAQSESVEQQPDNDVAALPPEIEAENENLESVVDEDTDPQGELAYAEGLKYYSGEGVERNFGTAAQYFMKAAEQGHSEAQYSLGLMNYVGQTGGQDFSNAAKWFQMAAESGHIQAQYNLGFLYYEGKGVQQDLKTAYGWIDRAAQQGYAKAVKARDALQKAMPEMFGS